MATSLDKSLDDLIKNRTSGARGRGQGRGRGRGWARGRGGSTRGRGSGMARQGHLGVYARPNPHKIAQSFSKANDMIWRHDLFSESMKAAGLTGVETGSKLYISNLDYGVSNEDIKELFSEIGPLKRCAVHYDRTGRPSGSAEVVFTRRNDALAALKRYNNVQLDGKAMKIEVVGMNLGLPVTPRVNIVGITNGRGMRTVVMTWSRGGFQQRTVRGRGRGRGQIRGRGGRGRGRGRRQPVEKSADQLDKELETYHSEAMNTS